MKKETMKEVEGGIQTSPYLHIITPQLNSAPNYECSRRIGRLCTFAEEFQAMRKAAKQRAQTQTLPFAEFV